MLLVSTTLLYPSSVVPELWPWPKRLECRGALRQWDRWGSGAAGGREQASQKRLKSIGTEERKQDTLVR
jgi:hypothetical protein